MLKTDSQIAPALQGDIMAVDTLFKRIAERGHKIRTQNKSTESESLLRETTSAEQAEEKQDK